MAEVEDYHTMEELGIHTNNVESLLNVEDILTMDCNMVDNVGLELVIAEL